MPNPDAPNREPAPSNLEQDSATFSPWFSLSLLVAGTFFIVFASRIEELGFVDENDPGPRAFPVILSTILLAGGGYDLLRKWWLSRGPAAQRPAAEEPAPRLWSRDVAVLFVWLLVYLFAVPWLGFHLSTWLLSVAVMLRLKSRWWVALLAAILLIAGVQLLFVGMFEVQLPQGVLGEWVEDHFSAALTNSHIFRRIAA